MQPPQQFNEEIYEEVKNVIRMNASRMAPEAEFALAHIAGGPMLRAAVHLLEFPPCPEGGRCIECWVNKWCVHNKTPLDVRMALINALGVFTTPNLKMSEKVIERIKSCDKTNPRDVGILVEIARHYEEKLTAAEQEEEAEDDQAEDPQGNKPN